MTVRRVVRLVRVALKVVVRHDGDVVDVRNVTLRGHGHDSESTATCPVFRKFNFRDAILSRTHI
jgi:hypothetical protein